MERARPIQTLGMFRRSILLIYEHMGNVFLMSAIWLGCALTLVFLPPATVAVYYTMKKILAKEDVSFADSYAAFKRYFVKSYILAAVIVILMAILFFDMMFFATVPKSPLIKMMSGLLVWPLIFVAFASNYVIPLLVVQDIGPAMILKRASLLVLDNLGFSIVLGLLALLLVVLGVIVPPFGVLAFASVIASFQLQGLNALLKAYGNSGPGSGSGSA